MKTSELSTLEYWTYWAVSFNISITAEKSSTLLNFHKNTPRGTFVEEKTC